MASPSQMSLRRIPDALHLKVRIAYAAGWEALIETQSRQALEFICEFASRLPVLEGLDLFFRVIPVPDSMQEVVRCRALTLLDLETLPPLARRPTLTGWRRLRLDLVFQHRQAHRRYDARTLELARMVGARAAEAVIATHVENAVELARLLKSVMPVNAAAEHYLREFMLPESIAQMVRQRVAARVAGEELTAQTDEMPAHLFEEEEQALAAPVGESPVPPSQPEPSVEIRQVPAAAPEPAVEIRPVTVVAPKPVEIHRAPLAAPAPRVEIRPAPFTPPEPAPSRFRSPVPPSFKPAQPEPAPNSPPPPDAPAVEPVPNLIPAPPRYPPGTGVDPFAKPSRDVRHA